MLETNGVILLNVTFIVYNLHLKNSNWHSNQFKGVKSRVGTNEP